MLEISGTEQVRNKEVLRNKKEQEQKKLVLRIKERELKFLGHVTRKKGVENLTLT